MSLMFKDSPIVDFSVKDTPDLSLSPKVDRMFKYARNFKGDSLKKWDVSKMKDLSRMFYHALSSTGKPVKNWDVSNK